MSCILGLLLLLIARGDGLAATSTEQEYLIDVWQVEHGLPDNSVTSIAQTPDGYLWFGTFNGLVRFDGVRFKIFDSRTPGLESERVLRVAVDGEGALWISMEHGELSRYANGRFTAYHREDGWPVEPCPADGLARDHDGRMLFLTTGGRILRFEGERFVQLSTEMNGAPAWAMKVDEVGGIWVFKASQLGKMTEKGWTRFVGTSGETFSEVLNITSRREGGIWVWADGQLAALGADGTRLATVQAPPNRKAGTLFEDSEGRLWIGTWGKGLMRVAPDGNHQTFSAADGLTSEVIRAIFEDREGNIWVATNGGGIARMKRKVFSTLDRRKDFPDPYPIPLCLAEDGNEKLWVGCLDVGLYSVDRKIAHDPKIEREDRVGTSGIWAALAGGEGNLWIGAYGSGFGRLAQDEIRWRTKVDGLPSTTVGVLCEMKDGTVWVGTIEEGLSRFDGKEFRNYTVKDGLLSNQVRALAEDSTGTLWIGTIDGGLNAFKDGQFTAYTRTNGLPHHSVRALLADQNGTVWIGTGGGLCVWKDGRLMAFDSLPELADLEITVILDDGLGYLWCGSNRGIVRMARAELEGFARGEVKRVETRHYGKGDGLASVQVSSGQPSGIRTRDGRLWFATLNGLSWVDPRGIKTNSVQPSVLIEEVLVDGKPGEWNEKRDLLKVPPGSRRVEIRYTGVSLTDPEGVRFRRKVTDFDRSWQEAGAERVASYNGLPPGKYQFQVIAGNKDGVWNTAGATLGLMVQPAVWQTWWFRGAGGAGLIGLMVAAFRKRVGMLEARRLAQEAFARQVLESQEVERRRIAAELHDSLGQELVLANNLALLGGQTTGDGPVTSDRFGEIRAATSRALDEVHAISYALRPPELDRLGLARAVAEMVRRAEASSGIKFERRLNLSEALPTGFDIQLFRIAQEAVNNLVKHSGATTARVDLWSDDDGVHLVVTDDGRGFSIGGSAKSGLGLTGIAERVRLLKGKYDIISSPNQGTTVTVLIPLENDKSR